MKPTFKKNSAVFYPQGFVDGLNANFIIEASDISFTISKKPKAVFISLKKVIFFNKKGLSILMNAVRKIQENIHCSVGFCEYDKKKYDTILSMFENELDFSLFENIKVLSLFFDDTSDIEKKILVYNDNNEQKNQLAIELYEAGYKPCVAKDKTEYFEKKDEFTKYGIVISLSYIANVESNINVHIKDSIIFYKLNNFIDSTIIKKFDLNYHNNLLRIGFKVFAFDLSNMSSMNIHGVNFLAKLSTAGAEYDATFCMVGINNKNLTQKLKNDLEDSGIILYKNMESFFADEDVIKSAKSCGNIFANNKKLTKNIIANLNIFIDTAMHITAMLSQKKGNKESVKIDKFILDENKEFIVSLFGIYGDINALMTIVFSKKLLIDTCKIFINDTENNEEMYDALVEYTNIIASKIKSSFKLYKIEIETTLPRVLRQTKDSMAFFDDRKGVLVELSFNGENLKLFLSK